MPNQMPIPTDWNEEEQGYALAVVCFPNSDQWRRNLRGAIYALTRGRNYDFDTGHFLTIEPYAVDIWDSFMACDFQTLIDKSDELIKTQRMIVAALMGQSINFDTEPLPNAINYENGIRQAILSVGGAIGSDMTLAELIAAMEAQDGPDYGFKDWLEILRLFQEIFNGAGLVSVGAIGGLITAILAARTSHNTLAIQAMQATALRGIQNAIAPPKDPETEQETVTSWMDTLEKIPFLTTAIIALVDPSPAGEGAMAAKIALTVRNLMDKAFSWISDWWNNYVSTVGNPQPAGTVVGMLSEISRKIQSLTDEQETPTVTVSNRLKLIAEAIEGIETNGTDVTPSLVSIAEAISSLDLPEGVTWVDIFTSLEERIGDSVPVINVTCSSCGSSGGCGCGNGASSGAYGPGIEGPEDTPPTGTGQGEVPQEFSDEQEFLDYKCKAANVLVLNLAEMLLGISENESTDFSQYPNYNSTRQVIVDRLRQHSILGIPLSDSQVNWLADKIMAFVWPYPSSQAVGLAIFEGIRLEWLVDRSDNVCGLYTSESTSEARDFIEQTIDGYIDATSYSSDVKSTAKEMYKGLLSNNFLSRLFEKDTMISNYTDASAVDCSQCLNGYRWDFNTGTEQWTFQPIDETGGDTTGIYDNGGLLINLNRTTSGNMDAQWIYEGPLLSVIQAGRTIRAEVVGVSVCASASILAINFDTGPSQSVVIGPYSGNNETLQGEFVIDSFVGQAPVSISMTFHSGPNCNSNGNYQGKVNWVEVV